MKQKWKLMYADIAKRLAQESHATRLKVGALFVSKEGVMSSGINGLPAGGSNECEHIVDGELKTKLEVSHAEENLMGKMMRQGVSTVGGTVFVTHAPCINCSKILLQAGIEEVYYLSEYKSLDGVNFLKDNNVNVSLLSLE